MPIKIPYHKYYFRKIHLNNEERLNYVNYVIVLKNDNCGSVLFPEE